MVLSFLIPRHKKKYPLQFIQYALLPLSFLKPFFFFLKNKKNEYSSIIPKKNEKGKGNNPAAGSCQKKRQCWHAAKLPLRPPHNQSAKCMLRTLSLLVAFGNPRQMQVSVKNSPRACQWMMACPHLNSRSAMDPVCHLVEGHRVTFTRNLTTRSVTVYNGSSGLLLQAHGSVTLSIPLKKISIPLASQMEITIKTTPFFFWCVPCKVAPQCRAKPITEWTQMYMCTSHHIEHHRHTGHFPTHNQVFQTFGFDSIQQPPK